jgi:hypothetical protein
MKKWPLLSGVPSLGIVMLLVPGPGKGDVPKGSGSSVKHDAAVKVAKVRVDIIKAEANESKAEMETAQDEFDRNTKTRGRGVSEQDYVNSMLRANRTKAKHEKDMKRVVEAEALVEYVEITGEIDTAITHSR